MLGQSSYPRWVISGHQPKFSSKAALLPFAGAHPIPRIQMLDGFNEGWIVFETGEAETIKGATDLEAVLRGMVETARQTPRDEAA
jgi:hypothetical protein